VDADLLSGDLDRVFTVLYEMGRVEPLLGKDWQDLYRRSQSRWPEVSHAIKTLNTMGNLPEMRKFISKLPAEIVDALVIEVARELAQFHQRDEVLH
jgi:hypothetical protein